MDRKYLLIFISIVFLGISIIISTLIISNTIFRIKNLDNVISVTGSTRMRVRSDIAKWVAVLLREDKSLKDGYSKMAKDFKEVMNFYKKNGISEKDLIISPVNVEQPWAYGENPRYDYVFRQTIEFQSNDIEKVSFLAKNIQEITEKGVDFRTLSLEYYYSKLPELRVSLLNDAMIDAMKRAEMIAKSTGRKISYLKSANMGVVQVLAPNSTQVSDYGSYDTTTIEKDIMITVSATFFLK